MTLSPSRYRTITLAALLALGTIVVSGAAVRLTGSGLGCDDWPACNNTKLIDVSNKNAAIEQINRLFTGLVSLAVVAAVLGSLARTPRRRDLTWLSLGLVAGVAAQIVLGGITVLVDLHPAAVQGHMVLSMILVGNAVVLVRRAGDPDTGGLVRPVSPEVTRHVAAVAALTAVAIVTGTVVTGAGPHAGEEDVRRFGIEITNAARLHSVSVIAAVAAAALLGWRLQRRHAERSEVGDWLSAWVVVAVMQGAIGYIQYFSEVPALLVGVHVLAATVLWSITVALMLAALPSRRRLTARGAEWANSASIGEVAPLRSNSAG